MEYRRPVQVLVHAVQHTAGGWYFLMLHRVPGRGSFWQGVSGGAQWGESLEDAARRELLEETGLQPIELCYLDFSYTLPMQESWKRWYAPGTREIVEHVYLAIVESQEPVLHSGEHDDWRWCTFEQALALLRFPDNVEALRICRRSLAQR